MVSRIRFTRLASYYEALLHLHDRNTEYAYESHSDPPQEQGLHEPYRADYGRYRLEWEHGYYGGTRFADGSTWYMEPRWEVGKSFLVGQGRDANLVNIEIIVSLLPATAALSLRRCSQSLASRISLDQRFWRNALIAGDLIPWLWDLDNA